MEIRVLGGLPVQVASGTVHLGTPKQRTVLAVLAIQPGQLVTVDQLIDELWGDRPPQSAVPNVRTYAANLRRTFEALDGGHGMLVRKRDGYRINLRPERVDLVRFESDFQEARDLLGAGDPERAAAVLDRAVARWRGPMLAGVTLGPVLAARVAAATERRLLAVELLAETRIRLRRHDQAVPLLRELLGGNPLRETTHLLLMQALYERGDHAGAVAAYNTARDALHSQLGIAPGAELQRLHRSILDRGQQTAVGTLPPISVRKRVPGPRTAGLSSPDADPGDWLPRVVPDVIGRTATVARLVAETRRVESRTSAVHLIDGMAGTGKTTLAVHLARRFAVRYPDAQLFIDLRGHGGDEPVEPAAALATLLRQLGVPGGRIPAEPDYRVELWRRELARRRAVVVLDNAASGDQVLPLLPTAPGTVVLVTSRRRLTDLDVGPPESLPLLSSEEGIALLASAAGAERVAAEPAAAAAVVQRCGHLPLAIRLAGARLAHRPGWRVADLAELLADGARGIAHLALGDRTVAGAFATSYDPLDGTTKRLFRMLSAHPGRDFGMSGAAALSGLPIERATEALDELVDGHLVEEVTNGRYRMHDLLRQFATELSVRTDSARERDEARSELLDLFLHAALRAAEMLEPNSTRQQVALGPPRRPDLVAALGPPTVDWLEEERANLVALVVSARENGHHDQAWRLARLLWRFWYIRAYFDDIILTHRHGLAAAEAAGDMSGMAAMNNYLASAFVRTGDSQAALKHVSAAVAICERQGERSNLFRYWANLGVVHLLRGDLREAVAVGVESLRDPKGYGPDEIRSPGSVPSRSAANGGGSG